MAIERQTCHKCKHTWFPQSERLPLVCPKCKSYSWNENPEEQEKKNE